MSSNANNLARAMNTHEARNVLAQMNRVKARMIKTENTDPRLRVKMHDMTRQLENLRLKLRRIHNKAYRNYMNKAAKR